MRWYVFGVCSDYVVDCVVKQILWNHRHAKPIAAVVNSHKIHVVTENTNLAVGLLECFDAFEERLAVMEHVR